MSESTIDIVDLKKSYGSQAVLNGVNLRVPPGAVVGLMGTNGAGKSTLIKCLLNLLHPDSRHRLALGLRQPAFVSAAKERLGYVPQVVYLYPWMKVRHVIGYTASFYAHWDHAWSDELVRRWHVPLDTPSQCPIDRPTANLGSRAGPGTQARTVDSGRAGGQPRSDRPARVFALAARAGRRRVADGAVLDPHQLRPGTRGHARGNPAQWPDRLFFGARRTERPGETAAGPDRSIALPADFAIPGSLRTEIEGHNALAAVADVTPELIELLHRRWDADVRVEDLNLEEIFVELGSDA